MTETLRSPGPRSVDQLACNLASSSVEAGLGVEPLTLRAGAFAARLPLNARTLATDGRPNPFALGMLADMAVGVAVNSVLPATAGGPTVELNIAFAEQPHRSASFLVVESEPLSVHDLSGVARARIRDDRGTPVAEAWGIMATGDGQPPAPTEAVSTTGFDPRRVSVQHLGPGRIRVPVEPAMQNNRGTVHGGVLAGVAMTAQEAFEGPGVRRPLSLSLQFARPLPGPSEHVECHTEFVRRGRRFHTIRTRLSPPDGAVAVEATATAVIAS